MKFRLNIAIFGATGYTGIELIRLLKFHKKVDIKYLISKKNFNKKISDFYPALEFEKYSKLIKFSQVDWKDLDVIFLCLPTNESKKILKKIPKHVCIIDLSNDFRLNSFSSNKWIYGLADHWNDFYNFKDSKHLQYDNQTYRLIPHLNPYLKQPQYQINHNKH